MSHVSDTMTDKLARDTLLADDSKLNAAGQRQHDRLETNVVMNRRVNTAAAFIGGALGVAATALSPRATPLTIGIAAGVALAGTAGVYANHPLHEHIATTALDAAAIGVTKTASATIVGALSNFILGKKIDISETATEGDEAPAEGDVVTDA